LRNEDLISSDFTGGPGRTRTCNQTVMSAEYRPASLILLYFSLFRSRLLRFVDVLSGAKLMRYLRFIAFAGKRPSGAD
jgi:hypothetical protein